LSRKENDEDNDQTRREEEEGGGRGSISRWSPQDYMVEMDRMFRDFQRQMQDTFSPVTDLLGEMPRPRWSLEAPDVKRPFTDLVDNGNEYKVVAEVPGIPKDKLDITVSPNGVAIKGEAKTDIQEEEKKGGGFVRRERRYTRVQRNIAFPEEVVSDKAEAKLNNGLVEITVPKKIPTEGKTHKVEVK
jgi:HSP20 family protein